LTRGKPRAGWAAMTKQISGKKAAPKWALALFAGLIWVSAAPAETPLSEIPVKDIDGKERMLGEFKGKAILIVNVASKCGYTSQYEGLEKLYQQHKGEGLVIAGFPCNQFFGQEPGSNEDIKAFCSERYGVSFPMFAKLDVKGPGQHPLFKALTGEGSPLPGKVSWNFNKFLVDREGKLVARFGSSTKPSSKKLLQAINEALQGKP